MRAYTAYLRLAPRLSENIVHSLLQRRCLLLLFLPAATLAAPAPVTVAVTVVTHSEGTTYINPSVLIPLGMAYASDADSVPYALTLTSTFDWEGPLPPRDVWASRDSTQVTVDFNVGAAHYHYAGNALSSAIVHTPFGGGDGYRHEVWVDPNPGSYGYSFNFTHSLHAPAGSLGAGALAPVVASGAMPNVSYGITAYYSNDEYTFSFPMYGDAASLSLQVTSPVPEPAPFVLLAAGLLTLNLRRHGVVNRC
jgi:hypothetical protein